MAFSNFSDIRKTRGGGLSNMLKQVEQLSSNSGGGSSKDDDRYWQPEVDKAGNGMATIRFLPAAQDNDYPWARTFNHGFKNESNGKWYIEECPTTIGRDDCPVCKENSVLWNTGTQDNQTIVRQRKRKLTYVANILVIKDPKNPHNDGQIKLFKFGSKIFDKIKFAMQPQFEDETPIDPFDFWEGANFKLKICKVEGYRNYDRSEFESPSAVSDSDEEIESIWKKQYDLREFSDPKRFKSAEELTKRLNLVLGTGPSIPSAQQQAEDDMAQYAEPAKPTPRREPSVDKPAVPARSSKPAPTPVDDDDEAAYFASLLE
jgi:hypothetical protein